MKNKFQSDSQKFLKLVKTAGKIINEFVIVPVGLLVILLAL